MCKKYLFPTIFLIQQLCDGRLDVFSRDLDVTGAPRYDAGVTGIICRRLGVAGVVQQDGVTLD